MFYFLICGWEIYSLRVGKWEYENYIPKVFGAGLIPVVQLAFTGILTILIAIIP